jgi:hypothetical protein
MSPELVGALGDAAISFCIGVFVALVGYRVVGKRPGEDARYDEWHRRWGWLFRIVGPLLMAVAVGRAVLRVGVSA